MPFHIRQTIGTESLIHGTPVVSSVGVTMPGAFSIYVTRQCDF